MKGTGFSFAAFTYAWICSLNFCVLLKLEPYISIVQKDVKKEAFTTGKPQTPWKAHPGGAKNIEPFDINEADTTQLIQLRGIGSKLALRIIKFRDGLGGFHSVAQFEEVFGLSEDVLRELKSYARIAIPVNRIRINSATYSDLSAHLYLRRERPFVQQLLNYREQHGPYKSMADLAALKGVDPDLLRKMEPYFDFRE